MNKITVSDVTMQRHATALSFKEKIEIARQLDQLRVDVIHMPRIEHVATDSLLIRTVASFVKHSRIAVEVGADVASAQTAVNVISGIKKARLTLSLPVSAVQMEYRYHKKPAKMLELAKALFDEIRGKCESIELCVEDATRAEAPFLKQIIALAMEAGADTVTLCDDEGVMMPDEFAAFVQTVRAENPALAAVTLGVQCKNTHGMATAGAVMAMKAGAQAIRCCACGTELPELGTLADILNACGDRLGAIADLNYNELYRILRQIAWVGDASKSSIKGETVQSADPETVVLDAHDSIDAVAAAVMALGYDLSEEDIANVYAEFERLAEKKTVTAKDLDAIVATTALQVPPTYQLISYVINNGNVIASSAQIKLQKEEKEFFGICGGDGPIDAAFRALEQIIGRHFELDDFQIQSVTQGREAVGTALVRLRNNGKLYAGKGVSTDIIGASIRAYINAVNKIVYEEEQQ